MSEPMRYGIADNKVQRILGGNVLVVDPAGRLVEYADYARLQETLKRLRKLGTEMGKHLPDTDEANRAYIHFEAEGVE